jgi:DNA-binding XRE family transcriptional regulator
VRQHSLVWNKCGRASPGPVSVRVWLAQRSLVGAYVHRGPERLGDASVDGGAAPLSGVTGLSTAILSCVAEPGSPNVTPERDASFGTLLKRLHEAAGLTQEELASRAGLTTKAIGALERGDGRRPYPHTVRSLADALGLSPKVSARVPAGGATQAARRCARCTGDRCGIHPSHAHHPAPGPGAQPGGDRGLYPPRGTAAHPHGTRGCWQDAASYPNGLGCRGPLPGWSGVRRPGTAG